MAVCETEYEYTHFYKSQLYDNKHSEQCICIDSDIVGNLGISTYGCRSTIDDAGLAAGSRKEVPPLLSHTTFQ